MVKGTHHRAQLNLGLTPRTHMRERENRFFTNCPLTSTHVLWHVSPPPHKIKETLRRKREMLVFTSLLVYEYLPTCITCIPGTHGGRKKEGIRSLELGLQIVTSYCVSFPSLDSGVFLAFSVLGMGPRVWCIRNSGSTEP